MSLLSASVLARHRGRPRRSWLRPPGRAWVAVVSLTAAACGGAGPAGDAGSAQHAPDSPMGTPATAPPATEPPGPGRVLLAGDSIMGSLAPAVKAALGDGSRTDVRFTLTPVLDGDPPLRHTWEQQLPLFDPDVVVMFVGVWETATAWRRGHDLASPAGREAYGRDVLDPWIRFITAHGAQVVWVGHAPVGEPVLQRRLDVWDPAVQALPARWPGLRYVSSTAALNGPDASTFHPSVTREDGTVVRTRQVDGMHLCPDGAARLALVLLDALGAPPPASPTWQDGPWRQDPQAFPPGTCPPP